jgi:hypothetical protein
MRANVALAVLLFSATRLAAIDSVRRIVVIIGVCLCLMVQHPRRYSIFYLSADLQKKEMFRPRAPLSATGSAPVTLSLVLVFHFAGHRMP